MLKALAKLTLVLQARATRPAHLMAMQQVKMAAARKAQAMPTIQAQLPPHLMQMALVAQEVLVVQVMLTMRPHHPMERAPQPQTELLEATWVAAKHLMVAQPLTAMPAAALLPMAAQAAATWATWAQAAASSNPTIHLKSS